MDSMGEVVSAISGVMGMGQAQMIHRQGLEVTHQLHREAIAQAERFHQQSMDFDLLSAMRENSRDIWAQKNNTCVRGVCCVAVGGALVPSSVTGVAHTCCCASLLLTARWCGVCVCAGGAQCTDTEYVARAVVWLVWHACVRGGGARAYVCVG